MQKIPDFYCFLVRFYCDGTASLFSFCSQERQSALAMKKLIEKLTEKLPENERKLTEK